MGPAVAMQCGSCAEEIPSDSLFCPECGARQTPGASTGMGLNSANAPTPNPATLPTDLPPVEPMQHPGHMGNPVAGGVTPVVDSNAAPQNPVGPESDPEVTSTSFLSSLAAEIEGGAQMPQSPPPSQVARSPSDMVVDAMAEADREKKANARSAWLSMNQQSASDFLNAVGAVQNSPSMDRGTRSLDEAEPIEAPRPRAQSSSSGLPNEQLVRRMVEVAVRRVGRKRGVGTESPQVKVEGSSVRANVTYIDDGRVLDNPPELHSAFEHAIDTEIRLKGYDVVLDVSLFRSKDGSVEFAWGYEPESAVSATSDDEELFECGACGGLVRDSDPSCPTCGAEFEDDDAEPDPAPTRGGPPSGPKGPSRGGPPSGPKGPSRGGPPSGPKGPSRGGPPSGPKGPSRGGPSGGGPKGPGPKGPSGPNGPKRGGPPSGPKKGGPSGPKRKGPPR
ncbi:MAG: hypothetical protein VX433_02015 [Candidatus Thermoplasmatota archaeon]|nr:hypothetical protein [Candidatus Thermoplasmatota archaeon]